MLQIIDNGRGITNEQRDNPRSFGLRGIHERVAHLGGTEQTGKDRPADGRLQAS